MIIEKGYGWATHQPLIKVVMEIFKPGFVLELGTGFYSTPLFIDYGTNLMVVDNDLEWIKLIQEKYKIKIIYQNIEGLEEKHGYNNLSEKQKEQIANDYSSIKIPDINPNLLFVDQWRSCRAISINILKNKFDLIIYHDSEAIEENQYDLLDKKGFMSYTLKTNWTNTTLLSRISFDGVDSKILKYIDKFRKEYKECKVMYGQYD